MYPLMQKAKILTLNLFTVKTIMSLRNVFLFGLALGTWSVRKAL